MQALGCCAPAAHAAAADPWALESAGVAQPVPPLHLVPLPTSAAMGPAPHSRLLHADEAVARLWPASPLHPPGRVESRGQGDGPPSPTGSPGIKRGLHAAVPRPGESQSCSSTATSSAGGLPFGVTSGFLQVSSTSAASEIFPRQAKISRCPRPLLQKRKKHRAYIFALLALQPVPAMQRLMSAECQYVEVLWEL